MGDFIVVAAIGLAIIAASDVARKIRMPVERTLWLIATICLPVAGPLYWYYIQYVVVPERQKRAALREAGVRKSPD